MFTIFKKTATSQTHFGFTNVGSEMQSFRAIAIWKGKLWFGSPCSTIIYVSERRCFQKQLNKLSFFTGCLSWKLVKLNWIFHIHKWIKIFDFRKNCYQIFFWEILRLRHPLKYLQLCNSYQTSITRLVQCLDSKQSLHKFSKNQSFSVSQLVKVTILLFQIDQSKN